MGRQGATGGFKVERYVDAAGHVCAFYDSTLLFPKDVLMQAAKGLGVVVLDMSNPAKPVRPTSWSRRAMLSPHESLLLNTKRGLLGAELGNPATNVSVLDLYDVRTDCRHPQLLSTTPTGAFGHESGFAPDGRTYYITGTAGNTFQAVDVSNPRQPKVIYTQYGVNYHGLRVSNDGRHLYVANIGNSGDGSFASGGLRILDVSQIQARKANPTVTVLSSLTWPEGRSRRPPSRSPATATATCSSSTSTPTTPPPVAPTSPARRSARRGSSTSRTRGTRRWSPTSGSPCTSPPRAPRPAERPRCAQPVQGYAAHYCSMPTRTNPNLVACSMILSGLRIFDIRDLAHPKEVGYFNHPITIGRQRPGQRRASAAPTRCRSLPGTSPTTRSGTPTATRASTRCG